MVKRGPLWEGALLFVGASLLAKNSGTPRLSRRNAVPGRFSRASSLLQ
ncbi:hypothetical protein C4J92_1106 [Pseudomonas sp. R3-18-08]|nr:hypothetical protein C4J92_1106 [Pseudomonas sp. R3-18-08]